MNNKFIIMLCCTLVLTCVTTTTHASSIPSSCSGTTNTIPIFSDSPKLLRTVANGQLYTAGSMDPPLYIANVSGNAYDRGYAYGSLLRNEIIDNLDNFIEYVYNEIGTFLKKLPTWIQKIIEKDGIDAALEATFLLTDKYVSKSFKDQAKGMADALASSYKADDLIRVALFPELIQAACSMGGFYGESIKNTPGTLYQLRALDWGTDTPLQQYPLLLIHHPSSGDGHAFSALTWVGMTGALTGYSSASVGVCEKVWDAYNKTQNRAGIPWTFMFRDILQYDDTIEDAIRRVYSVERTCAIWLGVGKDDTFNAIQYSYEELNVFNDMNMTQPHIQFKDVVYVDKHVQPSTHPCMSDLIKNYYGSIDAQVIYQHITAEFQTGDMHVQVIDHKNQLLYISNASPAINGTATPAYNREFIQVDMKQFF